MSFSTSPKDSATVMQPPGSQSVTQKDSRQRAIEFLENQMKNNVVIERKADVHTKAEPPIANRQSHVNEAPQTEAVAQPAEVKAETPTPTAESLSAPEKSDPLSSHYARLAKNEKLLRAKAQEQKVREDALKAQEAVLQARELEYQSKYISKDSLKNDPLSILAEQGLTYDQLTQMALNAPKPEDLQRQQEFNSLKAEIAELRKGQEDSKKSFEEQATAQYKQAVDQIRQETMALVKSLPDEYEAINMTKSHSDVVDLIERTWKRDNILLSVEEAAREVETYLVEEATKFSRLKKIQQKLAAQAAPAAKTPEASKQGQPSLKTLTNSVGSTRQLSARERAMAVFRGEKV